MGEAATGFPGYDSVIRKECGTIGEILKENGYATSWFGKDHNTPFYPVEPGRAVRSMAQRDGLRIFLRLRRRRHQPVEPNLFRNTTAIYPFQGNPGWNLTTAMADEAIQYMKRLKEVAPGEAVLRLLRARRHPCAASSHAGMDQEDQRHAPVRRWLEQAARNDLRQPEAPRHHPANAKLTPWPKELPEWDSLSWEEKKLFIKQADVFGAYLAYTDHEIGRVIQAVEDMGKLNDTLIIYISGDNGASAEGTVNGTPNEFTTFNGVTVPVKDQFLLYEFWGSDRTFPHYAARLGVGVRHAVQMGEAGGVAFRRHRPGHVHVVARAYHGRGRHPPPVPPRHRHRADDPGSDRHYRARHDQRHQAAPMDGVSMVYTWDKANAKPRPGARRNTSRCSAIAPSITTAGWRPPRP